MSVTKTFNEEVVNEPVGYQPLPAVEPTAVQDEAAAARVRGLRDHAAACAQVGDWAEVTAALQELLPHQMSSFGADDPGTLLLRRDLAVALAMSGDPLRAGAAFEALLPRFIRVFGPDHEHTALLEEQFTYLKKSIPEPQQAVQEIALWQTAQAKKEEGDLPGAEQAFRELLEEQLRSVGPDHPNTLRIRSEIATLLLEGDNAYSAVAAFGGLLEDQLRVLGPDHTDTLWTRHSLAFARTQAGDESGGFLAMQQAMTDMMRVLGSDHPLVTLAAEDLEYAQPRKSASKWFGGGRHSGKH